MKAGTVAIEEAAHRGLGRKRAQQLDVALADPEQHGLDALLLHGLAVLHRHSQLLGIEGHGLIEVFDGHSNVINAPKHGRLG